LEWVSAWLVDPEARLSHAEAIRLMEAGIAGEQNPARGLQAAAMVEPEDRSPVEQAARGYPTVGEALTGWVRWFPILNNAAELTLQQGEGRVSLVYRVVRGQPEPPAFADSVIAGLVYFIRRNARVDEARWALHFTQPPPSYEAEYARFFRGPVRFGELDNALVLPEEVLAAPMLPRSATLTRGYQLRAERILQQLRDQNSITEQVRSLVATHLGSGQVVMRWIAERLAMSPPTLRRRLREEDATFSGIVDDVRRDLAERKLRDARASIGEIAAALGFSNVGSFDRAFRRWSGSPPSRFRGSSDAK
jgi:AraC-like DNA-binding protein